MIEESHFSEPVPLGLTGPQNLTPKFKIYAWYITDYYTQESIPQFLHNKPAFHNWHTIYNNLDLPTQ